MSLKGKRFTLAWVRHPRQQNSIFVLAIPNVNHPGKRILARHHRQISTSSQLCTTKLDTYYQRKFVGFFFLKKRAKKAHTVLSCIYFCTDLQLQHMDNRTLECIFSLLFKSLDKLPFGTFIKSYSNLKREKASLAGQPNFYNSYLKVSQQGQMTRFPHSQVTSPSAKTFHLASLAQHPAERGTCRPLRRGTRHLLKHSPSLARRLLPSEGRPGQEYRMKVTRPL